MPYSHYTHIDVKCRNKIATITLNRPETLNAVNSILHNEISTIFQALTLDDDVSLIIVTGAGRAFCAGGDLAWMKEMIEARKSYVNMAIESRNIITGILDCPKPIICRLNGDAIGFGATLALMCDIIIADETARIADPHVRIGLVAGDGGALIWPQLVGYARAKEYLLTGNTINATEAARIGLINQAIPAEQLGETVKKISDRLLSVSQPAMRYTKMAINIPLRQMISSVLESSLAYEGLTFAQNDDLLEGIAAFGENRKPNFPSCN